MKVTEGPLAGLLMFEPRVFHDNRGYFFEVFQEKRYREYHVPPFVQDNVSRSQKNVVRGLHYQLPYAQGKLVWVTQGSVWDVVVDIRLSSPTFGKWFSMVLSDENHMQMYIPPGFAHGFCVLSDHADFYYKCTDFYSPSTERGIAWNDTGLNIPWPTKQAIISPKDTIYPSLHEMTQDELFT